MGESKAIKKRLKTSKFEASNGPFKTKHEVKLFRTQLNIVKEHNLPIIVHTPSPMESQAVPMVNRTIDIIREENSPLEGLFWDTLEARLNSGAMVGLSVYYDTNKPDDAAEIIAENLDKRGKISIVWVGM